MSSFKPTILAKFLIDPDAPEDKNTKLSRDTQWLAFPSALRMQGKGKATVPATAIEKIDFTIGIWVRPAANVNRRMFVYANWKKFWSFYIALNPSGSGYSAEVRLRRNINSPGNDAQQDLVVATGGALPAETWKHLAINWNREKGVASIFVDGEHAASGKRFPFAGSETEIQSNDSMVHEIGYKADTNNEFFEGELRELVIARGILLSR